MRTESETHAVVFEHQELWFNRFPHRPLAVLSFPRLVNEKGQSVYKLLVLSSVPFLEADQKIFQDMDGFLSYGLRPEPIIKPWITNYAVIFEFPFEEKQ